MGRGGAAPGFWNGYQRLGLLCPAPRQSPNSSTRGGILGVTFYYNSFLERSRRQKWKEPSVFSLDAFRQIPPAL